MSFQVGHGLELTLQQEYWLFLQTTIRRRGKDFQGESWFKVSWLHRLLRERAVMNKSA
jgi:hypothetical protein